MEQRFGHSRDGKAIDRFDFDTLTPVAGEVNLGLAHGLPSLLLFCVQCCKLDVCITEASRIAWKIVDYLVRHINPEPRESFFPSIIRDKTDDRRSRLAWCYGDLGVAFALYRAGRVFRDSKILTLGWDVLVRSTHRCTHAQTQVNDACLCHGSAGIAHVYHRMWRDTGLAVFQGACDHWIERTMDYAVHPGGIGGFKTYDPLTGGYRSNAGFLEGSIGIGIVLLGYLTGDLGWDHCILLNN
jgi:hypothetical protein